MSWLRPEAVARLKQWRETMIGTAVTCVGGWIALTSFGLGVLAGGVIALIGISLIFTGTRHALFRTDAEAPGIVEVTEGRITYLGPLAGGTVALADLREVSFTRTHDGNAFWRLTSHEPQPLIIPAGASGVDVLLDTFTALPQFDTGLMVRAVQSRTPTARTIWHHPAHARTLKPLT